MFQIHFWHLMTETHHGWHQILKIKPTIITAFIGNIWKKGKQQVDYLKLQNEGLLELI